MCHIHFILFLPEYTFKMESLATPIAHIDSNMRNINTYCYREEVIFIDAVHVVGHGYLPFVYLLLFR